jgi:hypothetical protein
MPQTAEAGLKRNSGHRHICFGDEGLGTLHRGRFCHFDRAGAEMAAEEARMMPVADADPRRQRLHMALRIQRALAL